MVAINKRSLLSKNAKVYSTSTCKQVNTKWNNNHKKIVLIIINDQSVGSIWLFLMINMKSQQILNTLNVSCKKVANKGKVECNPHNIYHLSTTIYNQL